MIGNIDSDWKTHRQGVCMLALSLHAVFPDYLHCSCFLWLGASPLVCDGLYVLLYTSQSLAFRPRWLIPCIKDHYRNIDEWTEYLSFSSTLETYSLCHASDWRKNARQKRHWKSDISHSAVKKKSNLFVRVYKCVHGYRKEPPSKVCCTGILTTKISINGTGCRMGTGILN